MKSGQFQSEVESKFAQARTVEATSNRSRRDTEAASRWHRKGIKTESMSVGSETEAILDFRFSTMWMESVSLPYFGAY